MSKWNFKLHQNVRASKVYVGHAEVKHGITVNYLLLLVDRVTPSESNSINSSERFNTSLEIVKSYHFNSIQDINDSQGENLLTKSTDDLQISCLTCSRESLLHSWFYFENMQRYKFQ